MTRTYTLTAYKPSGSSANCSRGCCGSTRTSSEFELFRGLKLEELVEKIAKYRIAHNPDLHREEYEGPPWELRWFDDTGMDDWEWNCDRPDYYEPEGFGVVETVVEDMVNKSQPIIKQRQEQAAKEAAEKAEREARIRQEKAAAEAKEKRDREEYARLTKKYGSGDV